MHTGLIENSVVQQLGETAAGALLQDVAQDAEVLIAVRVAGAWRELQRPRLGNDSGGFTIAERCLGGRAVEHRQRPIVTQA